MFTKNLYHIFLTSILLFGAHIACYAQGKQYTDQSIADSAQTQTLEERVSLFWQARKAGDLLALYTFEAVSITGQLTLRQYINKNGGLIYKNATILETNLKNDSEAYAKIDAEVVVPGLKGTVNTQFSDQWVKINGQWYHRGRVRLPLAKKE